MTEELDKCPRCGRNSVRTRVKMSGSPKEYPVEGDDIVNECVDPPGSNQKCGWRSKQIWNGNQWVFEIPTRNADMRKGVTNLR